MGVKLNVTFRSLMQADDDKKTEIVYDNNVALFKKGIYSGFEIETWLGILKAAGNKISSDNFNNFGMYVLKEQTVLK